MLAATGTVEGVFLETGGATFFILARLSQFSAIFGVFSTIIWVKSRALNNASLQNDRVKTYPLPRRR